ncbi:MAG: type II toxin-antitoxin system VapC family toxin [Candidatus Sumerlaeota bacterium]|nr:type II toxin-antitoxin system VapC family toxin [Candidatus Sumerlaeota bacterium]
MIDEVRAGDRRLARERLDALRLVPLLPLSPEAERLAGAYIRAGLVPRKALRDALHIAVASVHNLDYLLTWNCAHIAGGIVRRRLAMFHEKARLPLPTICTPEELMED